METKWNKIGSEYTDKFLTFCKYYYNKVEVYTENLHFI